MQEGKLIEDPDSFLIADLQKINPAEIADLLATLFPVKPPPGERVDDDRQHQPRQQEPQRKTPPTIAPGPAAAEPSQASSEVPALLKWLVQQWMGPDTNPNSVGPAGPIASWIPVRGNLQDAIYHFQNGRYVRAAFNGLLTAADVALVKDLATAFGKIGAAGLQAAVSGFLNPSKSTVVAPRQGNFVLEQGAKLGADEIAVANVFKSKGYDVTGRATASSQGIMGLRTSDLHIKGLGNVDVFTPKRLNSTSIARAIEKKNTQAAVVVVRGNISNAMMHEVAARVWGKPNATSIQSVVFERNGELFWFHRPN